MDVPPEESESDNAARAGRRRVAAFPARLGSNPYPQLLYDALAQEGIDAIHAPRLSLRWLVRERGRVSTLHIHWPEGLYRTHRGPARLQGALRWAKLARLAARLAFARALGYRIAWTVHQVLPHEQVGRIDAAAARVLGRVAHVLLVHDEPTREAATAIAAGRAQIHVVPHGTYLGVYPPRRSRAEVRAALGIADDAFVFLTFGQLRGYKHLHVLLDAFSLLEAERAVLLVAGRPNDEAVVAALRGAAERDRRIRVYPEFVPDDEVAELHAAADAAALARADGGTSGALVLALSLGLPPVVADTPAYHALAGEDTGWFFRAGDPRSLADALGRAVDDADAAGRRRRACLERAGRLDWRDVARQTAPLLLGP